MWISVSMWSQMLEEQAGTGCPEPFLLWVTLLLRCLSVQAWVGGGTSIVLDGAIRDSSSSILELTCSQPVLSLVVCLGCGNGVRVLGAEEGVYLAVSPLLSLVSALSTFSLGSLTQPPRSRLCHCVPLHGRACPHLSRHSRLPAQVDFYYLLNPTGVISGAPKSLGTTVLYVSAQRRIHQEQCGR